MIRRDYLLRMVDQCIQALARSLGLGQQGAFDQARQELSRGVESLTGLDLTRVIHLPQSELMAQLLSGEPTQVLRQKCMLLVALLHQAGDIFAAQSDAPQARACHLRALNLYLDVLNREGPFDYPECVPKIEVLLAALEGEPLPLATTAALMQSYEQAGAYAKAEDALFDMLDSEPSNAGVIAFGVQFYERLLRQPDDALHLGNLPRAEVEAALAELRARGRV
jgi:hypothetical protein